MSDEHDHSKPGHSHDHHDHGHDHHHEQAHRPAPETPPTMEDASSQALSEALRSSFGIVRIIMIGLVIVFLSSGFFKVQQGQRAVRLNFGKPVGEGDKALLGPGLHWSWPYPIDEVVKIPYSQNQQVRSSVGWYAETAEQEALDAAPPPYSTLDPASQGYVITGDQNIIHARATLVYRIEDPIQYEFGFTNASRAVQDTLDNALLYSASRFKVDDVLYHEFERFQDTVRKRVVELAQKENLGIEVVNCQVERIAPGALTRSFESVLVASTDREKIIDDANREGNTATNLALGTAAALTNNAQAERETLVKSVAAEAQQFTDLLPRYQNDPALLQSILWNQTISRVFTNLGERIYYLPQRADGEKRELRLDISREPISKQQPRPGSASTP